MCVDGFVGNRVVTNQGELAEALGLPLHELVREPQFAGHPLACNADACLCPVDGEATAARAHMLFDQCHYGDGWCSPMHFRPPALH